MRILLIISMLALSACASTGQIESVEQQLQDGQETIIKLDEKITHLEQDKQELEKQLQFVDGSNQTEALGIREKIATIDSVITTYKQEIVTINETLHAQSGQITSVTQQQSKQKAALAKAIQKNQQLKQNAAEEIRALEKEYEEKRKKKDNPDQPNQEN